MLQSQGIYDCPQHGKLCVAEGNVGGMDAQNQPLLASFLNQLVMVAADVDNDLFDAGGRAG